LRDDGTTVGSVSTIASTWLPMAAVTAGAPPVNGTCTACTLATSRKKYSAPICGPVPTPALPKVKLLLFPFAMNSFKSFAGLLGCTARTSGLKATTAMARRSSTEKPLFLVAVSLTASEVVVARMV